MGLNCWQRIGVGICVICGLIVPRTVWHNSHPAEPPWRRPRANTKAPFKRERRESLREPAWALIGTVSGLGALEL
jgi:hypothetical protein